MVNLFQGKNILIVDDEVGICEMLADEFALRGATVLSAHSGESAFRVLNKNTCDVVISDLRMLNGDGAWLMERINESHEVKPKLFLCSGMNDLSEQEFQRLGLTEIFDKPFDWEHMIGSVAEALGLGPVESA